MEYINVLSDTVKLDTMMEYSHGRRKVPIIVDKGKVIIGFNGKA